MIDQLKQIGVNFIMMPVHKGAGMVAERENMQDIVEWARRCHAAGLHVRFYADSGTLLRDLFFREKPEAKDWLLRDRDGRPILYSRSQPFRYKVADEKASGYILFAPSYLRRFFPTAGDLSLDLAWRCRYFRTALNKHLFVALSVGEKGCVVA